MSRPADSARPSVLALIVRDLARLAAALLVLAACAVGVHYGSAGFVLARAEAVAAGWPACIVVGREDRYEPASRLADLSVFRMRAPAGFGGLVWRFHAVLVVDDGDATRLFNWSWRRLAFDPASLSQVNEVLWPGAGACRPGEGLAGDAAARRVTARAHDPA